MRLIFLISVLLGSLYSVQGTNFVVGNVSDKVKMSEIQPYTFYKGNKTYFYNYNEPNNRPIEGIQALDNLHSKASIEIVAGGIGQSFVILRMKSEKGLGLDYDISIYVHED